MELKPCKLHGLILATRLWFRCCIWTWVKRPTCYALHNLNSQGPSIISLFSWVSRPIFSVRMKISRSFAWLIYMPWYWLQQMHPRTCGVWSICDRLSSYIKGMYTESKLISVGLVSNLPECITIVLSSILKGHTGKFKIPSRDSSG